MTPEELRARQKQIDERAAELARKPTYLEAVESERAHRHAARRGKFVQIVDSNGTLFALDRNGVVWFLSRPRTVSWAWVETPKLDAIPTVETTAAWTGGE